MPKLRTSTLEIAYEDTGPAHGDPVVLLHGFPYDPRAYDEVVPPLVNAGFRAIVPYLRGYGPTRFLSAGTPRSGQQAALGKDLLDLLDGLHIDEAGLVGYDWGGRAACIVAALWPKRVRCLITVGGYNIQNIAAASRPADPEQEYRAWYQYYFHTERGRAGLTQNRRELTRLLWRLWSPTWSFDDATFERSAASFDNPDFVDVVIHSYRHRYGYVVGDPALESIEQQLADQPPITVPTLALHGTDDGVAPPHTDDRGARLFIGPYQRQLVPGAGHNLPQENPETVVAALLRMVS
ncbi:MAG TPA: alpha/beta hydrolase [Chloroflexota bacterium]|jgi:pimeloyl-ACP methyl ester carboxylesterase